MDAKTYGEVRWDASSNTWRIACDPHVGLRLKRLFEKIDKRQHGWLALSATSENSRELEWFLERFPMDCPDRELLHERARKHREKEALLDQMMRGLTPIESFSLKLPPREYQSFAARLWLQSGGLLLADDVGLGKTVTALCGLTEPGLLPALIVCPTHLPIQWRRQIAVFTDLDAHILKKGQPYNLTKFHQGRFPDIIISNYHKLAGWASTLAGLVKSTIFEEVHELRHPTSNKYAAAKHIAQSVQFRVGLSATPIFGYGGEIFNILDVLSPGSLGTRVEFDREWCTVDSNGRARINDPRAFGLYLRDQGLYLRRTKVEVGREIPPITIIPHYIDANPRALLEAKGKAIELAKLILSNHQDFRGQQMRMRGEFDVRMRQATGVAKAPYVADFIRLLHEETGEKIIVGCWHREVYEILLEKLADLQPVMYTGTESAKQKDEAAQRFISGDSQILLLSNRSGSGLDGLQQVCRIVVFAELDYAPAVHEQVTGRVARDGQEKNVLAYYLLSDEGSDPVISDMLGVKKQQADGIANPNRERVDDIRTDEDHVRRMAVDLLTRMGIEIPTPEENAEHKAGDAA
jgi:SNF2 family DNA or RNA helicase